MACNPRRIINKSQGIENLRFRRGDTNDIVSVILDMDKDADRHINTNEVECLRGESDYETLKNVWAFVKFNLNYKADRAGHEKVKSPAALFKSGFGDCKSFSIAEAAICRALGYTNLKYRFAAYGPGDVTHVYLIADLDGREIIMDAVHSKFNQEVPYFWKMDKKAAKISMISGIGFVAPSTRFSSIFSLALICWGIYNLKK